MVLCSSCSRCLCAAAAACSSAHAFLAAASSTAKPSLSRAPAAAASLCFAIDALDSEHTAVSPWHLTCRPATSASRSVRAFFSRCDKRVAQGQGGGAVTVRAETGGHASARARSHLECILVLLAQLLNTASLGVHACLFRLQRAELRTRRLHLLAQFHDPAAYQRDVACHTWQAEGSPPRHTGHAQATRAHATPHLACWATDSLASADNSVFAAVRSCATMSSSFSVCSRDATCCRTSCDSCAMRISSFLVEDDDSRGGGAGGGGLRLPVPDDRLLLAAARGVGDGRLLTS